MLTQTKEVRDAWRASQRTLDIKVAVNGKTYTATDINSLKYDSGAYTGDTFAIGSTYSNNVQIEFSHLVEGLKLGMEVHPSIGIKTSKGYIYEPLGIFIISSEIKMDRNNNLTSISASDRFCGLEGTYKSKLVYPAKVLDIVAEICAQSGVKANADDLARLPHQADIPIPISGQSYRKALGWIAQLYAGYATFDRQGLFTIRTIAEPNYELDPSQYEQAGLTKNEAPYKIGGIQCQTVITTKTRDGENTEETKTYQVGDTSGSQIKLENNIMTPDRLNNIWEQIKDISFYPFNLNWFGNPAIEAGDWLRLEDKQGNKFIVPNNSYTLDFNGGLSATSKADQTSSTDSAISWRGTYAQIIEELQARKAPDGTVIFPPSVAEPPKNAKPNDVWFKQNGNSTELWVFTVQEDGSGKWIRRDLTPDEIKKQVQEAQNGLNDAKKQIADNLAKADGDIAELNASIRDQKKAFDTDIDELNASIRDQKKAFDTDIDELNASIRDQKGTIDGLSTTINTVAIPKITDVTNKVSDALTKINDQKNIVTGLQTQSAQQGKDISKITTDIHGVSVDLANLNGDVNQTKVTVQGLQSTLGNAQGDIAQIKVDAKRLETSLSGKVDNSTYANFVNQTNQALNAKLVASDLNGYAKTTDVQATAEGLRVDISSVTDRMNNLKIGSVNQLRNTDPDSLSNTFPDRAWRVDSGGDGHGTLIDLESKFSAKHGFRIFGNTIGNKDFNQRTMYWNGGEYVFTVYIRLAPETEQASATALIRSWNYTKDVASYLKTITITSKEWHKFSIEIDSSSFYKDDCSFLFGITGVGSLDFAEPMLVTGNVASDWSPNPDDLTTQVAFSELVQTVSGLQSTVSGNYGGLQSQISQTAQAIHGELSNQITGVQNQITATANGLNARIDNIRIGGRNLLRGTSDQWRTLTGSNWLYGTTATDMWTSTAYYRDGAQFTYSATITNTSEVPVRLALYCYDNDKKTVLKKAVGPTVGPNSRSIHTYVSITIDVKTWFLCSDIETLDGEASTFSIQVKDEQLEEGNVRTAWTTNPDDIASQFTEVNATINGLQSTVSGNYGALQTQISQTAQAIHGELSNQITGVQNQITATANGLNARIDNIRIGGRNLLRGTSDQWRTLTGSNWLYGTTATDMWTSTAYYRDGAQFTYSATITNTSEVPVRLALYCYDNDKKTVLKKAVGPTVGPNSRSIHTYVSITIDVKTWFLCSDIETLDGEASTFSIQVKDEQLEEGNVRTAWTTNPDDIASQFTEVNATINGLKSTVSGNYGTLNSQISQTAKTIRQEVSDKTNGLQTQINQQANNFNVSLNSLRNETAWQKVTSAIDANNYKTTGNYWIQAVPNSNTPDSSAWAYLQVVAYPDVKRIKQTWQRDNNENEIYTRLLIGDNWTSWQRTVTGGNIMAQINMSAGTTLIQNDKIYMDASSTVFSGKAFIPDAAITNISADKINTGTLDAGRINVINLNANNITTGTINGANLKIDLNSGNVEFQRGRIHSSNNLLDINIDENYISTANWGTRALLKNGELQLTQPNIFDTNNNSWYFRLYNGGGTGDAVSGASLIGRDSVTVSNKANSSGAMGFTSNPIGTADFSGLFTGKATTGWLPTILGGANRGIFIKGGTNMSESHNILDPNDGGVLITGSPFIAVGATGQNVGWWGNRIVIEGEYLHSPTVWRHTTGSAPNVFVSRDGALVRSTSASKYKTDIKRSYSTEYGEKLLNLPTAIWTDKGQKERYEAGKRHIKPEKYFGMIAEDLADAGLDLLVSRNPLTHEIEGIQYERIAPALLPVIKELKDKVNKLEKKVNE